MREVRARFSVDEVAAYAVSTLDSEQSILQWIADTGLRVPVIVDSPTDLSCWEMPEGNLNLYTHFLDRSESDGMLGPFPLQVIFAPDGTLAYIAREHHPSTVIGILEGLLDQDADGPRGDGMEEVP